MAAPGASLPSSSSGNNGENELSVVSHKQARVFGGGPEDRASPCRLFGKEFEKQNAEMEEMEFDFMFRHGTIVLRVEEDKFGKIVSEVGAIGSKRVGIIIFFWIETRPTLGLKMLFLCTA